jgi:hypothetical protein
MLGIAIIFGFIFLFAILFYGSWIYSVAKEHRKGIIK